jgi:hypothetical protein
MRCWTLEVYRKLYIYIYIYILYIYIIYIYICSLQETAKILCKFTCPVHWSPCLPSHSSESSLGWIPSELGERYSGQG